MSLSGGLKACALAAAAAGVCASAQASKLVEVRSVDDEHIMVYWQDARMNYQDDGKGPTAFMGHETRGGETMTTFGPPLDTKAAQVAGNYTLASKDDGAYAQPLAATAIRIYTSSQQYSGSARSRALVASQLRSRSFAGCHWF